MSFGSILHDIVIDMNETRLIMLAQFARLSNGTLEVRFRPISNDVELILSSFR